MWLVNGIQCNYTITGSKICHGEKVTFNEHLQRLSSVGSWGTQVELQAVIDSFNVTVFVCSPNISQIIRGNT